MDLPQAAIELWLLDRARHADEVTKLNESVLSQDEIARAAAMTDPGRARLWSCGRSAVRLLIHHRLGLNVHGKALATTSSGRPRLDHVSYDFSLADSGPYLLIGLSHRGRIGVDLEQPRALRMSTARLERLVAAAGALTSGEGDVPAPLQAWTRIEAFAKATAPTLAASLDAIGFSSRRDNPVSARDLSSHVRGVREAAGIAVMDLDLPHGLIGALACPAEFTLISPRVRELDADMIRSLMS